MTAFGQYADDDSGSTLKRRDHKDATDLVVTQADVAGPLDAHYGKGPGSRQGGEREYVGIVSATGPVTHALTRSQKGATAAGGLGTDFEVAGGLQAVGFDPTGSTANVGLDLSPTLRGSGVAGNAGHHAAAMTPTMAVRRLLPMECERLQGFPDNWTLIPWKNRPSSECPDGPRYKAMGNSMAVPVMRWIGERLDRVVRGEL